MGGMCDATDVRIALGVREQDAHGGLTCGDAFRPNSSCRAGTRARQLVLGLEPGRGRSVRGRRPGQGKAGCTSCALADGLQRRMM